MPQVNELSWFFFSLYTVLILASCTMIMMVYSSFPFRNLSFKVRVLNFSNII